MWKARFIRSIVRFILFWWNSSSLYGLNDGVSSREVICWETWLGCRIILLVLVFWDLPLSFLPAMFQKVFGVPWIMNSISFFMADIATLISLKVESDDGVASFP